MQKKLIVLAIAALASTSAFADTSVYGVADAALVNISGSNEKSQMMAVSGGLATSRFGVNAAEDLGDGLKAVVNLEYGLDVETSSTVGATSTAGASANPRQQMLALAGGFGTVATGFLQTAGNDFSKYDVAGGSSVSALQNVTGGGFLLGAKGADVRAPRALAYISPDMGGLSFALNYATALSSLGDAGQPSTNDSINRTAMLAAITYAAGPLSVNVTYASNASYNSYVAATAATVKNVAGVVTAVPAVAASETSTVADSEVGVGVSYDAGVATIKATYQSNTPSGGTSVAAYSVGAVIPVSSSAVALSYAANTATNSAGATSYTAAFLHPMSKTTTAYVAYSGVTNGSNSGSYSVDNGAIAAGVGAGGSSTLIALGLNKKF